jgi:cell division inhibitor SepF
MGVRDRLERVAAWFGFGVDEDDYYEEEEERRSYGKDRYAGDAPPDDEPRPTVRRLGRSERSSAFGTSLGDLFGSEGPAGSVPTVPGQAGRRHTSVRYPTSGFLLRG